MSFLLVASLAVRNFAICGGLVAGAQSGPSFWQLEFARGHEKVFLDDRLEAVRFCETNGNMVSYHWQGLNLPNGARSVDVRADVERQPDNSLAWMLYVTNRSPEWALYRTRYPYLRNVAAGKKCAVLYPGNHLGAKWITNWQWANRARFYPGTLPMVTAFVADGEGLYFAAHDGEARLKGIRWQQDGSCYFETLVENAGVPLKAAEGPRYRVVTASFRGDWFEAAKIYRAWALKQKWCALGPIIDRKDYPKAMVEPCTWWRLSARLRPENAADLVAKTWPGIRTGFRYYGWNKERFDTFYPEFTPCAETPEFIRHARELGVTVLPYVNGKIWDSALPTYEAMRNWFVMHRDGSIETETYSARPFAVVCPAAECWHEKLKSMHALVIDAMGSNGIYYDQIGIAPGIPCWNSAHAHPIGGGRWWADGYRKALKPIHEKCSAKGYPIATEGFSEMLVDRVDGFLICGRQETQEDVPFHTAVYAGYSTFFNMEENETDEPKAFFALQVRALMRGIVPGTWRNPDLFNGKLAAQSEIIYKLAKVRAATMNYLAYGSFEGPLRPLNDLAEVTYAYSPTRTKFKKPTMIHFPEIVGTMWKSRPEGNVGIFAANVSTNAATCTFASPLGATQKAILVPLPDQKPATCVQNGKDISLTILPGEMVLVEIKR